ncbi:MAG: glycoside hydrolase family protein [Leptolyngbya sp. SIO1E4]|nr:glycoside hydrolase family protein [Leptolyngbya sp. SIO1E4]
MFLGVAWLISSEHPLIMGRSRRLQQANPAVETLPLAMNGGDPHVRALMRTISAAESNTAQPYHTLYGGQLIHDLSQHPDVCIDIVVGPNVGDCTTAAGRYQFLTTTWLDKAENYHSRPPTWYAWWVDYSFEPVFQDEVVYRWLTDHGAWGVDISELLRQGRLEEVLQMLSGTWTSLGYGIEDNSVTPYLGRIYQEILEDELRQAQR